LVRTQVATSTQAAASDVIAEQVIGFKIGVSLYDNSGGSDTDDAYIYNSSSSNLTNFTKVRAIRISLICRTPPTATSTNKYTNTFDNGPYKIEASTLVINPRNLSMKDQ
jgi:Type IV Pilus-assembly protein W